MMWLRRIALVTVLAVVLAACGDDDDTDTAVGEDTTTSVPADDETTTSGPAAEAATVQLATAGDFGEILVDADGMTLYLFENDEGTTTACTGGCAENWPPLVAEDPVAGEGVDQALLSTAEGIEPNQVVYNGHLLYYFAGDDAPGDVNGAGIPAWFPVSAAGEKVEA